MDAIDINRVVEINYDVDIKNIEKVKNAYKIDAKDGRYCLKVIGYQFPHFYFIL